MNSWNDFVKNVPAFFEVLERSSWVFLLASFSVLCTPVKIFSFFTVEPILGEYREYVSGVFVVSLSVIVVSVFKQIFQWFKGRKAVRYKKGKIENHLRSLNSEEREVIYYCLDQNSQVCYGSLFNPALNSLCARGVMRAARGNARELPFLLKDEVWEIIGGLPVEVFDVLYANR